MELLASGIRSACKASGAGNGTGASWPSPTPRSPSPGCAWTRARVGAMSSWRGTTSTRRSARETNTHWRWASSSAGRTTSCRGSRMRSAPGRARSRRTPPSPVCAGRSGPIRCAAPTCWRRAACASSPVESTRVAESERALRSLFVFSRVRLDTTRIAGRLALRVTTSDGWSTKPQFGYSTAGGDATWLAGLVEENVFGTATALSAVYNKTPDRTILAFRHINPHFFGRRTRLAAEYASKSDGKHGVWFMGGPFFETRAARALAIDGEAASERVVGFRDGDAEA